MIAADYSNAKVYAICLLNQCKEPRVLIEIELTQTTTATGEPPLVGDEHSLNE